MNLTVGKARQYIGYRHPHLLLDLSEAEISNQVNSIKYIEHLGAITGTSVDDLNLNLFINESGRLHKVRSKINEEFFKWKANVDSQTPVQRAIIPVERLEKVEKQIKDSVIDTILAVKQDINAATTAVYSTARLLQKHRKLITKYTLEKAGLEILSTKGFNLVSQVEVILTTGFYELGPEPGLCFITKPITLSYFNREQAVNLVVSLGRFKIAVRFPDAQATVTCLPYENNVTGLGSMIHPHVSSVGNICFGDQDQRYQLASSNLNLTELMYLVELVLTNYHDGNPFLSLYRFEQARQAMDHGKRVQLEKLELERIEVMSQVIDPDEEPEDDEELDEDEPDEEPEEEYPDEDPNF